MQGEMRLDGSMNVLNYALRDNNGAPACGDPINEGDPIIRILPGMFCGGPVTSLKPNAR